MKKLGFYGCDGGSILFTPAAERDNPKDGVTLPNGLGDGGGDVFLVEEKKELDNNKDIVFIAALQGSWDIRDYDCDLKSNVISTVEGRFGIYHDIGDIYIEIWETLEEIEAESAEEQ